MVTAKSLPMNCAPEATASSRVDRKRRTPAPAILAPSNRAETEELWSRVVEAVSRASKFTGGYLISAHPVSFAKNVLTIGFDPEFEDQLSLVDQPRNHTLIQTKLAELGHANCQVKFIKADAPAGRASQQPTTSTTPAAPTAGGLVATSAAKPPTPVASTKDKPAPGTFNKDDFKNDPLIQKALEIFKGQIVEVRT